MPDNLKAVAVGEASASKQNLVESIAAAKTTALAEASAPASPAIPMQRSMDPNTYSSLADYQKYVGPATTDIARDFMLRDLRRHQTNYQDARREAATHEDGAWAKNDELGTVTGTGKQFASAAAGFTNEFAKFGAVVPDTLKAHFSQGSEVDERGRELFTKNQDRLNTENELHNRFLKANAALTRREISPTQMQEEYAAIKAEREALPKLTDEENAYLDSKFTYGINEKQGLTDTMTSSKTRRESLQGGIEAVDSAARIAKMYENNGVGDLLNTTNRAAFNKDLDKTIAKHEGRFADAGKAYDEGNMGSAVWNASAGIAGIVKDGVGDIVNNPAATMEYVAENAPLLAMGAVSPMLLGAANTAYSLDIYRQALADYKDQNGILPTQEDAQSMLGYSLAAGALENITDMSILKLMRGDKGVGSKLVGRVLDGLDNKIVNNGITRVAGNTFTGFLKEGGTELAQTAIEENFSKLNTDFNLTNLAKAGLIGGAVGSVFSGAGSGFQEIGKAATAISKYDVEFGSSVKKPLEFGKQAELNAAVQESAASGNVDKMLDSKSRIYNPRLAMYAMGVYAAKQQEAGNTTNTEAGLKKIGDIVDTLRNEADEKTRIYEASLTNDDVPLRERNRLKKEAEDLQSEVNSIEIARSEFFKQASPLPKGADMDNLVEIAAENPKVAEQVIHLTMRYPNSMSPAQVAKLRESGSLNEGQLAYIEGLEESRALYDNAIDQVTATGKKPEVVLRDVIEGGVGFRGMNQYRIRVSSAILSGNRQAATIEINNIAKFLGNHQNKAEAFKEAIKQFNAGGGKQPIYIIKAPQSPTGWEVTSVLPAGKKAKHIKKESGFVVEPGFGRAAENTLKVIELENKIIEATNKELSSAARLEFDAKPPAQDENTPPPITEEFNTEDTSGNVSDLLNTNATSQSATADAAPTGEAANDGGVDAKKEQASQKETQREERKAGDKAAPTSTGQAEQVSEKVTDTGTGTQTGSTPEATQDTTDTTSTETAAQPGDDVEVTEEEYADLMEMAIEATSDNEESVEADEPTRKEGGLAALDPEKQATDYLPAADLFNPETNFITTFFKQGNSTAPLASVPDFLTMLSKSENSLGEDLTKYLGRAPSGDEVAHFETLIAMWRDWTADGKEGTSTSRGIQTRLEIVHNDWVKRVAKRKAKLQKDGTPDLPLSYKITDLSPDLHLVMEENLVTAMVVAGFQWVAENSGGDGRHTVESLKRMLQLGKEEELAAEDYALMDAGFLGNFLALELGAAVTGMLNLKALDIAPGDMLDRLQLAIGTHILQTLEQEGIVEVTEHMLSDNRAKYNEALAEREQALIEQGLPIPENLGAGIQQAKSKFYRIRRNAKRELNPIANKIYEGRKEATSLELESGDIITKVFAADPTIVDPASEPGQFEQKLTKTGTKVPKFTGETLTTMSEREHGIREDMWATDNAFSDVNQKRIRGWQQTEGVIMHAEEARAQDARNVEYERDLENLNDYRERIKNGTFYLVNEVWKHQRIGQASNTINTQTSKSQRHHVFMKAWETEVDPTDKDSLRNKLFMLSVAQGLGIKTDKMKIEDVLKELDALVKSDPDEDPTGFHAAMAAVSRIPELAEGEMLTLTEQEDILWFTNQREKTHTLDALVHWAAHEKAKEEGTTFTSRIMYEIDGVTNGPAFALLMLGMMGDGGRFGMFNTDNTAGQWLSDKSNIDLYQTFAATIQKMILDADTILDDPAKGKKVREAYAKLNGLLNLEGTPGRNAVKTPTQSIVFGAGAAKAMQAMGMNSILPNFYSQMTAIARDFEQGEREQVKQMNILIEQVNSLLWGFKDDGEAPLFINRVRSVEEGLTKTTLSDSQIARMRRNFDIRFGKVTKAAVNATLGSFMDTRSDLNQAATGAAALYRVARKFFYDKRVAELVAEGKMHLDPKGNPVIELSKKDLRELDMKVAKMLPIVPTAMSQLGGGAFYEGIRLDKQSMSLVDDTSYKYAQEVHLGANYKGADRSHEVRSSAREFVDPGVAPFVLMLHSFDSAVLHKVLAEIEGLGIHDAIGLGIDQIIAGGTAMNKAVFDLMLQYSIPMELSNLLGRVLTEGQKLSKDNPGLAEVLAAVELEIPFVDEMVPVDKAMQLTIARTALIATRRKLVEMDALYVIEQYAMEGAGYVLSKADHTAIAEKIEAVDKLLAVNSKARAAIREEAAAKWEAAEKARAAESKEGAETNPFTGEAFEESGWPMLPEQVWTNARKGIGKDEGMVAIQLLSTFGERIFSYEETMEMLRETTLGNTYLRATEELDALVRAHDPEYFAKKTDAPTAPEVAETRAQDTPWGVMGESSIDSVPEIEALFKNGKGPKLGDFIKAVSALSDNAYYKQLLGVAGLVVDADTELYLIDPDTAIDAYPGLQDAHANGSFEESAAVFSVNGGKSRIFFKSSVFFHSGLNVETVTHELVHGGTAQAIATFKDMDPKKVAEKDKVVYQAVQELKALYGQMETAAKGQFELAFVSLDEFVAHGMTDKKFQDWLAEQTAQVSAKATAGQAKSALRKFIEVLSDIFFHGRNKEVAKTAMGVLITNTGLLFADKRSNRVQDVAPLTMKHGDPRSFNSEQVFEALEDVQAIKTADPDFRAHLLNMLNKVTEVVYQGGVLKPFAERQAPATPLDIFIKAITTGEAPFASKLQALRMSNQELFTAESIEVVMRHILDDKNNEYSQLLRHELTALMAQARKVIEPMNLAEFDLLFRPVKEANGSINHLSQFMAAALTYKPLYDILNTIVVDKDMRAYKGLSVGNKIKMLFERVMRIIRNILLMDPTNRSVQQAMKELAVRVATVEAKRKATIQRRQGGINAWVENKEEAVEKVIGKGKAKLAKAIKSPTLRNHKSVFVKAASVIGGHIVDDTVENYMEGLFAIRNRAHKNNRLGVMAEVANEMRINSSTKETWEKLLVEMSKLEQDRLSEMNDIGKFIREAFGSELSEHELNALTRIFIRGDLQSLLDKYGLNGIDQMLSDEAFLDSEIAAMEQALPGSKDDVTGYIIGAKNLAWYMTENKAALKGMSMNAHNIAFMAGTEGAYNVSNEQGNSAQAILEQLISMYFVRYSSSIKTSDGKTGTHKTAALDVLRRESARTNGNGVEVLLKISRETAEQAKQEIFDGSDIHMQKGYVKETFDHTVDLKIANDVDGAQLLLAGYTKVGTDALPQDPADPTGEPRYMFVIKDKGLPNAVGGALSSTNRKEMGYTIQGAMVDADGDVNLYAVQMNAQLRTVLRDELAKQRKMPRNWDPRMQAGASNMVPVYNKQGQAVKFRYLMSDATKDSVLNRINTVDKVMGNIAGSILDKARSPQLNRNAIDAFRADYVANFGMEQDAFIRVAPDSADPQIAERFRLLPRETQDYIRDVWGERGMWVRNEAYVIAFGYKKYSMGEMFDKAWADRSVFQKLMTAFLTHIPVWRNGRVTYLGQRAATRIVQAENMWMEIVKWVKDAWVIKNIFTLIFNESSNLTILMLSGVPLVDIVKNKVLGVSATLQYRAEAREKAGLERMVRFGIPQGADLTRAQDRILELEASLKTNPIAELIDAGMFQTLVEDIGQENDPYSYQSRLERFADKTTKKVLSPLSGSAAAVKTGKVLKTVGKNLLMTHDTGIYKFANQATILSDFTSRYVMYKHFTTRKRKPMAKDEALSRARKAFVNYDVPTHVAVQYLNDTGIIWFTKYYLRIQAVIAQLIAENPVRAAYLIAANNFLFPIADILDSSMFTKWPVNLGAGALEVVGAPPEIATMNAALWSLGR